MSLPSAVVDSSDGAVGLSPRKSADADATAARDGSPMVLIMDDDPITVRLFRERLEREGFRVDCAENGREGLARYDPSVHDVLIVDFQMPAMDGLDVLHALRRRGPMPPVVIVTGTGDEEKAVEAMRLGVRDYLVKDWHWNYMDLLPSLLRRARAEFARDRDMERMREELRRSETRYRELFDLSFDGVILSNMKGRIVDANVEASRMYGYLREELLLMKCCPLNHESHHARRQAPGEDGQVADIDQGKVTAVLRMEVRRIVIVEEHLDDNAEEPADFRHGQAPGATRGKRLPVSCPLT